MSFELKLKQMMSGAERYAKRELQENITQTSRVVAEELKHRRWTLQREKKIKSFAEEAKYSAGLLDAADYLRA